MQKKIRFIFLLIVISLFLNYNNKSSAQIIKGQTVDQLNNGMAFATISILSESKDKLKILNSDSTGRFAIPFDPSFKFIAASYLGNSSDTISISPLHLHLLKIIGHTAVDTVHIERSLPKIEHFGDRLIYTPGKRFMAGSSVLDALKIAPLIDFNQKDESFSILGKEGTIIYINNRKSDLPKEMILAELKLNPVENIESIEIITNPGSEFSANTSGGIININLKRMSYEGLFGVVNLSSEQGPDNTTIFNGALNYRYRKLAIRLSPFLNRSYNKKETEYEIGSSSDYSQSNISYHRKYTVIGGGVGADYDLSSRTLISYNGFLSTVNGNAKSNSNTTFSSLENNSYNHIRSNDDYFYNFGNIFFQHKLDESGGKSFILNVDYNQFDKNVNDEITTNMTNSESKYSYNIVPQNFFNLSEKLDYIHRINNKSRFTVGAMHSYSKFNSNPYNQVFKKQDPKVLDYYSRADYDYNETYFASYVTFNTSFSKQFNMNFGLRVEKTQYLTQDKINFLKLDTNYIKLFPSISAVYNINKNNILSAALSRKIQRPSMEILLPGRMYHNQNYYTENDPFLLPSLRNNAEVMYSNKGRNFISLGLNSVKSAFSKFLLQVIDGDEINQKNTYINYGSYDRWYVTASTRKSFIKERLDLVLATTVNLYHYDMSDLLIDERIHNFNFSTSLNVNYSFGKNMFAYSTVKFNSKSKTIAQQNYKNLYLFDFGARKSFDNFSINIYLSDILNTYNNQEVSYLNYNQDNKYRFNNYTRSISLSLKYQFGNKKTKQLVNKSSANEEVKDRIN